jgi:hypothetical protein
MTKDVLFEPVRGPIGTGREETASIECVRFSSILPAAPRTFL